MTNFDVYLADAKTVAIAGHVRPDGDCAGSCLATYNYIKNYFPQVEETNQDESNVAFQEVELYEKDN